MSLNDALTLYRDSGIYPFHMPGHKRNPFFCGGYNGFNTDITEIDGFDNLHDAGGIIASEMRSAARLYGSERSFYLINGSTCGILAGVFACTRKKDKILAARNCHKSVYNAIALRELEPVWLMHSYEHKLGIAGSISPAAVEAALTANTGISLVIITSPTYEGVTSDIAAIAQITHKHNIPLLVDEAHGAHFGFAKAFPRSSVQCGADIVVHGLHKTLPSPTQTALLHINGDRVDADEVRRQLAVFESSSPSYILMAGISGCIQLMAREGEKLFKDYTARLDDFFSQISALRSIRVFCKENKRDIYDFDRGKLIISVKNTDITGTELKKRLLDRYLLQTEMAMGDYVLAMTSICDTDEGFLRLGDALLETDRLLSTTPSRQNARVYNPETVMIPSEAISAEGSLISLSSSAGAVSKEYVYAFPPGIPLIAPGERITEDIIYELNRLHTIGITVKSCHGRIPSEIYTVKSSR